MDSIPSSVPKTIAPFLARAKELSARDPVMAYWCKFKAAQVALDHLPSDDEGRGFLGTLMDELEDTKASMSDNDLISNDIAGSAYISNFAARVFEGADAIDRDSRATRTTAKEFLAAAVFYEILSIFGPLETDVSEKIVYAKWKATAIAKAFREGRQPSPGPANAPPPPSGSAPYENGYAADSSEDVAKQLLGGQNAPFNSEETAAFPSAPEIQIDSLSLPSTSSLNYPSPSMPPLQSRTPPAIPPPTPLVQPPRAPKLAQQPVLPPPLPAPALSIADNWEPAPSTVDPTSIGIAQKHAKWAISALNYEDLETARTELRAALQIIGG